MSSCGNTLTRKLLCRAVRSAGAAPKQQQQRRQYASAATSSFSTTDDSRNSNSNSNHHYVSPMQDLFDTMKRNGPTTLGTTQFSPAAVKLLKCGVAEHDLRFTTTSYGRLTVAPHVHPAEHRVVLQVSTDKLQLTDTKQQEILKEIVGSRWNEERQELRLTSDQFGSRIENKRHLVSMLDRIVLSSQRLAKEIQEGGAAGAGTSEDSTAAAGSSADEESKKQDNM
jgi:hypothetical protein